MSVRSVLRSRTYPFGFRVTGVTVGDSARDPVLAAAFHSEPPKTNIEDATQKQEQPPADNPNQVSAQDML
jgi:hypothetical protein